ncbi:MAG: hypothetical protein H7263_02495 [Candidatus Sericytochromatia bacterium]|nr:hypothetical protein [Candidatus Sericytochromatia bacterium]
MFGKIITNLSLKPLQDDHNINKPKPTENDKEKDDTFNCLIEDRINAEKNQLLIRKKLKKPDEANNFIPIYTQNVPILYNNQLVKFRKDNKNRCLRCGNIVDSAESININQKGKNSYVCSKCMNNDIKDFLTYNYL